MAPAGVALFASLAGRTLQIHLPLERRAYPINRFFSAWRNFSSVLVWHSRDEYHKSSIPQRSASLFCCQGSRTGSSARGCSLSSEDGVLGSRSFADSVPSEETLFDSDNLQANNIFEQAEKLSFPEGDPNESLEVFETNCKNECGLLSFDGPTISGETIIDRTALRAAEKDALQLLAGRSFTVIELRKKLQAREHPAEAVDAVLRDIMNRGFLNDGLFAETYSRSRWQSSTWGPGRIKRALLQKGISEKEAQKALKSVFEDCDGHSADKNSADKQGLSQSAMDHLLLQASKQWIRGKDATIENRRARLARWLQYRGFSWRIINVILHRLQTRYPR